MFDIVIPVHKKDMEVFHICVRRCREYVVGLNIIYVVTNEDNFPDKDEQNDDIERKVIWISEENFPFSLNTIEQYGFAYKTGWYFQQLIKLYAVNVIPNILENVLVVDADTIFLNTVHFFEKTVPLYSYGEEYYEPYFDHMKEVLPDLEKIDSEKSGICHHMMFQKHIIDDLFYRVEQLHKEPFWRVFLDKADPNLESGCGASEYEMYFNFVLKHYSYLVKVRKLRAKLFYRNLGDIFLLKEMGYAYACVHNYSRDKLETFESCSKAIVGVKRKISEITTKRLMVNAKIPNIKTNNDDVDDDDDDYKIFYT